LISKTGRIDRAELLVLLKKAELFSSLLDDDLGYIADSVEMLSLAPGETLFAMGEKAERFFIVNSGEISIFRPQEGGSERHMASYVAGDVIGDFDFALGTDLDATARADSAAELAAFPRTGVDMQDIAREMPGTASRVLLHSLSMISSRLRSTQRLISENSPWLRELRRQIYTDPSTGLWSRAFLDEELHRNLEAPTAIILVKPDRFKELNDAHGHGAGDEAMGLMAGILVGEAERLGRGWALRMRSNETAVVVPRCDAREAWLIARRMAHAIAAMDIPSARDSGFSFTSSISYAVWPEDGSDWKGLVDRAYALLTEVWRSGGARLARLEAAK
jgi:diguanylate cyclase (GGDEF)-like protein